MIATTPTDPSPDTQAAGEAPLPLTQAGLQRWLEQHCTSSEAVCAGLVTAVAGAGAADAAVAAWPAGVAAMPDLEAAARAATQRGRSVLLAPTVSLEGARHNRVIALPVRANGGVRGAVALAVQATDNRAAEQLFQDLVRAGAHLGGSLALVTADLVAADRPADAGPQPDPAGSPGASAGAAVLSRVLALQALALSGTGMAEGATALVTELATALGSERVSLGLANPDMTVLAVSHSADFGARQALLRAIAAAMEEAAEQGARVSHPANASDPARLILAHAELRTRSGHALLTVPLVHGGRAVGALLAEFHPERPPSDVQRALCEAAADAVGPLLALRQAAELPLRRRALAALRALGSVLRRRDDPLPRLVLAAAAVALAGLLLVPVDYRIGAPVRIEGAVQRVVAAPFDGFLQRSLVRPGDTVRQGQLLVELADQDLALEQRKWEGTLTQQENVYAAALARSDRSQFIIARGKADEARAQLELVRQQLARTRLLAPIDGVVIKGDLSQALGAPVQRGDTLLTVAPSQQYRVIAEVDERDIADIRPGQAGQLALASLPSAPLSLVVERVTPVSTVLDGRNVFEVEARLTGGGRVDLRPGLQGVVRIDAGRQTTAWIWSHRLVDSLRMAWWKWGP